MPTPQILVVEDEGLVARDIQRSLTRWGYAVPAVVPSGEEAVVKAEELHPDLVLMDIRLKGAMSGIEAGELVRTRLDVPVVFLTAYADDAILARAKDVEPFRLFFLEDPFAPEDKGYFKILRGQCATPIAMGELFNNPNEWLELVTERLIAWKSGTSSRPTVIMRAPSMS